MKSLVHLKTLYKFWFLITLWEQIDKLLIYFLNCKSKPFQDISKEVFYFTDA